MFQSCRGIEVTLGNLPSDVIRKVVEMLPIEAVDGFRKSSPKWNAFGLVILSDKKKLPVINRFMWNAVRDRDLTLGLRVCVGPKKAHRDKEPTKYKSILRSMSSSDGITISNIPSDIIRMIIAMELESIDEIRMISHRWNNLAMSHLRDRKRLPVIKHFSWEKIRGHIARPNVVIEKSKRKYFGIQKWSRHLHRSHVCGKYGKLFENADRNQLKNDLAFLFGRCSGVDKFSISFYTLERLLDVKDALRNIIVNELEIRHLHRFDARLTVDWWTQPRSVEVTGEVDVVCSMPSLTLADMPSDIIRKIIIMELESIDEIRMISELWNSVVSAHLSDRKRLPVIKCFSWDVCAYYFFPCITISRSNENFFGIEHFVVDMDNFDEMIATYFKLFAKCSSGSKQMRQSLTKLFARCSVVEHFVVHNLDQFFVLEETLRDVIVVNLVIRGICRFDASVTQILRDFVSDHSIRRMHLHFNGINSSSWSGLRADLSVFFEIGLSLRVILYFQHDSEERRMSRNSAIKYWKDRLNGFKRNGKFAISLDVEKFGVTIFVIPKAQKY
ncbi:hypothetical protein PRIPAC_71118 [Pristionchus pacificus]|uniref:F-box domain-containing protein n=1 Tax=Pristionchus pacificus TaxID=54126 RepID=A0A2A6BZR7_PRIPA|nr:hypothetical protein PRIPAC_71118 [Pristionchus pacificus]|eukprot:PDM71434.1 F-box domain-containing protein [Pristionchus pacificus]